MVETYDFDAAVIGGGSAGYAGARRLAELGLRAVVIEGGEEVGGLCILRGCMPSKALLYAAEVRHLLQHAAIWGVKPGKIGFDFAEVMARKNAVIQEFATYRQEQLMTGAFTFSRNTATFLDPHTLQLSEGGTLTARHFLIATGSEIAPSPLPSLPEAGYLTSDDALRLTALPKSIIVLGGGAVGVEFAQFFSRFDVKVTLVQRSPHVLHEMDPEVGAGLEAAFRSEGIEVYTGTRLIAAGRHRGSKWVSFDHLSAGKEMKLEAEEIFFALGRVPKTGGLGLEKAGVKTAWGRIVTDPQMATTAEHIYAAGDCAGLHEIVHIAIQQAEIAAHNIAHPEDRRSFDERLLALVIFTDPPIATVGLTEGAARSRQVPYLCARYPFADHGKSIIMNALQGFVKLLASPKTGEILGGCVFGPSGGELIHEIVAAMAKRMTVHELRDMPHYHPTLAEIWAYPAEELAGQVHAGADTARTRSRNY